jgi:Amt family ammonium transporter
VVYGYSLAFTEGNAFFGGLDRLFFKGMIDADGNFAMGATFSKGVVIPEMLFAAFQCTFAAITVALILGGFAERIKFSAVLIFSVIWFTFAYCPVAHMVWFWMGPDAYTAPGVVDAMNAKAGYIWQLGALDFAGGTVVHMSSGWSALILSIILGKRLGFGKESFAPHSMVLCMVGTGMLWVGWYGFNAGSAVAADGIAANAFTTTTLATAVASFVWPMLEWITRGKPSILGFCSGAVAGLVVITPACGFVTANGAVIIGLFAGLVPWFFCWKVKGWFGYDDALDTFGVHAVGGTMGAFLTGVLARNAANANLALNLKDKVTDSFTQGLVLEQVKAIGLTLVIAILGTVIIAFIVKAVLGLRPTAEAEEEGLDLSDHGEEGYILEAKS